MPALDALQDRFAAAHTQPLGISVDSIHCHRGWAQSLGGISLPLLADFHPKGEVAKKYGLYLADAGITDRATVIIDAGGVVRHASSVTPSGERNIAELAARCEKIDRAYEGDLHAVEKPPGIPGDTVLYIRSTCGFSRATLAARTNLHLEDAIPVRNVSEDAAAMADLETLTGKQQAPCLVVGGEPMLESSAIIQYLTAQSTGLWA